MVRRALLVAVSATLILATSGLLARAVDLQPGLWDVSRKIERDGVVIQRPTRTKCVTPEISKKYSQQVLPTAEFSVHGSSCKIFDLKNTDKEVSWRMQCSGVFPAEQTVRFVIDSPQHYTSEMKSSVRLPTKTMSSTSITEGQRVGECPK